MTQNPCRRGRGVTLIEIVVVISIVAVLTALSLVGVSAAREWSRKATCAHHLAQLGLAVHSFETGTGKLPLGNRPPDFSIHVQLLPYLEQKPLYDAINFTSRQELNSTVGAITVAEFLCPSDRGMSAGFGAGSTNYAGNRSVGVQRFGYNGAFPEFQGPISSREITDGTSHTVMMSEWVMGPENRRVRDARRSVFRTAESLVNPEEFNQFAQACHSIDPLNSELGAKVKGRGWMVGEFGNTLYNHTLGINDFSCLNGTAIQTGAYSAGSFHSRGANCLFADGHVSYLKDSVELRVWRALGSRNGGEVINDGDF